MLRIPNYRSAGLAHRPRKILLFVNPFGGKKKGLKIWEKDVQPLMTIAGIDTKILVTERVGHARDILLSVDLSDFHVSFTLRAFTFLFHFSCSVFFVKTSASLSSSFICFDKFLANFYFTGFPQFLLQFSLFFLFSRFILHFLPRWQIQIWEDLEFY